MQKDEQQLKEIISDILSLKIGISQKDNIELFNLLSSIHPMELETYSSGAKHNGWVVPQHWEVDVAEIRKNGELIFNGKEHYLAVGGSSHSFNGSLTKEELSKHVVSLENSPAAYVYNPLNNLRPWQKKYSFSIPYNQWKEFGDGVFDINLKTNFLDSKMIVGNCFHQGESDETIVLNAHTCHPMQVNDGFSGVLLILKFFENLLNRKTKYSYLGVIAPEHLGTIFYLANKPDDWLSKIKHVLFIESIASSGALRVQKSFDEDAVVNRFVEKAVYDVQGSCASVPFRTLVGNDETVWEAGGINKPTATLTRHPFEHYHTQHDDLVNFDFKAFFETERVLTTFIDFHERDKIVKRKFRGLIALSNPEYNLYKQQANQTIEADFSYKDKLWARFQDYIFQLLEGDNTVFSISAATNLPFQDVYKYLNTFKDKNLLSFEDISSLETYKSLPKLVLRAFTNPWLN